MAARPVTVLDTVLQATFAIVASHGLTISISPCHSARKAKATCHWPGPQALIRELQV